MLYDKNECLFCDLGIGGDLVVIFLLIKFYEVLLIKFFEDNYV